MFVVSHLYRSSCLHQVSAPYTHLLGIIESLRRGQTWSIGAAISISIARRTANRPGDCIGSLELHQSNGESWRVISFARTTSIRNTVTPSECFPTWRRRHAAHQQWSLLFPIKRLSKMKHKWPVRDLVSGTRFVSTPTICSFKCWDLVCNGSITFDI